MTAHHLERSIQTIIKRVGPLRHDDLVRICGITDDGARKAVQRLRAKRLLRVERWVRGSGRVRRPTAVYGLGGAPDAVFVPLTKAEQMRRHNNRGKRVDAGPAVFSAMTAQLGDAP